MPKGVFERKKKVSVEAKPVEKILEKAVPEVVNETPKAKEAEKVVLSKCPGKPHLSRCQCKDSLSPGQAYFEDGPTGTVIIGDDTKNEIMFREGNNGKGYRINRKR